MQPYSNFNAEPLSEVYVLAPFMGYGEQTAEKLLRMEVINENGALNAPPIITLATVFASNFADCFNELYDDNPEILDIMLESVKTLNLQGEINGSYINTLIGCGMVECPIPGEFVWIARRKDALTLYMQTFIEALDKFIMSEDERDESDIICI